MKTMNQRHTDPASGNGACVAPDPEVVEKPKRRQFTAELKRRIVAEAEACTEPGEIGALLRREGLYSSVLSSWRRQAKAGAADSLTPKKRGRKPKHTTPEEKRIAELEKETARLQREQAKLEAKLRRAEQIIAFQKKVASLLEIPLSPPESNGSDS
jgi:transposase-like protein